MIGMRPSERAMRERLRAASAKWRTKQLRRLSGGFFDSALAFFQLNAGLDCARNDQMGMSKGVISDGVARL